MTPTRESEYFAYRDEIDRERTTKPLRSGIAIVAILSTSFIALDFFAFRAQAAELAAWRLGLDVVLAFFYAAAARAPRRSMIGASLATGAGLVGVINAAGGVTSAYFPGLMLLFLGMPVLLPLTARQAFAIVAILFASYASLPLIASEPVAIRDYVVNLFFPAAAAIECVASCALLDRLRFQDYLREAELVKARDELAKLDDAKTRFSANVHHELRTPLTLVLAPLEAMASGDFGELSPLVAKTVRTMTVNAQRLLRLINNLLDLAKLESAAFKIRRTEGDVTRFASEVVAGAQGLADRKGISLDIEAAVPEGTTLGADWDSLDKVLVNLVGNSLKFTPSGGSVVVRVEIATSERVPCDRVGSEAIEDGVLLSVVDTGSGIPRDQLATVFDRFAQVDTSGTRRHGGTGIGLSLAKELVELHEGAIWAESDGVGFGSRFNVWIPHRSPELLDDDVDEMLEQHGSSESSPEMAKYEVGRVETAIESAIDPWRADAPQGSGDASMSRDLASSDKPTIVIAEDNPDMRDLLALILGTEFRVRPTANGREALAEVEREEPALVLTDLMMPEMSGTELCTAIKSNDATKAIPVLLVTSKAERETKIEGLELGADDYVTKPFHPRELLARVRALSRVRTLQNQLAERNALLETTLEELTATQAHLIHQEKLAAVGELAAGIAHEVNNPVNFALNAARLVDGTISEIRFLVEEASALKAQTPDAGDQSWSSPGRSSKALIEPLETAAEAVEIIGDGLERTSKLVSDLRDFAAPGGGDKQPVAVEDVVESTTQLVASFASDSGIRIVSEFAPGLPRAICDKGAVGQVLLNLVKNAIDAIDVASGEIRIRSFVSEARVHVVVEDDGPGIEDDIAKAIFDPFVTTKPAGTGTGLGLSICRQIVEAHGGSIDVSPRPGGGASFRFDLPAERRSS